MDVAAFAQSHVPELTATAGLVSYALLRNKLTTGGIIAGVLVAFIHMLHPWPAFFWLLIGFFFIGTVVTRIGHEAKAHLTHSSTGAPGGEGPRTSAQVFANSGTACALILAHLYLLQSTPFTSSSLPVMPGPYAPELLKVLPIGIIAQYAAVAADTFSSELGILSKTEPVLITMPWKQAPKGTNGAVTFDGLMYGLTASLMFAMSSCVAILLLPPAVVMDGRTAALIAFSGWVGTVIDSILGATLQATVTDKTTGKVVEGLGGQRVEIKEGGGRVQQGVDLLSNNGVNFVMAILASLFSMVAAWALELGLNSGSPKPVGSRIKF